MPKPKPKQSLQEAMQRPRNLMEAVSLGDHTATLQFIRSGADPNVVLPYSGGWTPLVRAVFNGDKYITELLVACVNFALLTIRPACVGGLCLCLFVCLLGCSAPSALMRKIFLRVRLVT